MRRAIKRLGYHIEKNRMRDKASPLYGTYDGYQWSIEIGQACVFSNRTLEWVEDWIAQPEVHAAARALKEENQKAEEEIVKAINQENDKLVGSDVFDPEKLAKFYDEHHESMEGIIKSSKGRECITNVKNIKSSLENNEQVFILWDDANATYGFGMLAIYQEQKSGKPQNGLMSSLVLRAKDEQHARDLVTNPYVTTKATSEQIYTLACYRGISGETFVDDLDDLNDEAMAKVVKWLGSRSMKPFAAARATTQPNSKGN